MPASSRICGAGLKKDTIKISQRDYLIYISTTSCNRNDLLCNKMITSIVTVDNVGKARNDRNGLTLGLS